MVAGDVLRVVFGREQESALVRRFNEADRQHVCVSCLGGGIRLVWSIVVGTVSRLGGQLRGGMKLAWYVISSKRLCTMVWLLVLTVLFGKALELRILFILVLVKTNIFPSCI